MSLTATCDAALVVLTHGAIRHRWVNARIVAVEAAPASA
jgi:hypothetical protein